MLVHMKSTLVDRSLEAFQAKGLPVNVWTAAMDAYCNPCQLPRMRPTSCFCLACVPSMRAFLPSMSAFLPSMRATVPACAAVPGTQSASERTEEGLQGAGCPVIAKELGKPRVRSCMSCVKCMHLDYGLLFLLYAQKFHSMQVSYVCITCPIMCA